MKEETQLQNQIRVELSKRGGIVLRQNVGSFNTFDGRFISSGLPKGTPDLLYIGDGFVAFIEVKTPQGVESGEQTNFLNRVKKMGHRAGIARSVDDALKIINNKEE